MPIPSRGGARPAPPARIAPGRTALGLIAALLLAGCGVDQVTPSPSSPGSPGSPSPAPTATSTPSPTPQPTPRYTNPADAALAALIPTEVAGAEIRVPPVDEFAITPGDFGAAAYGELGLRFTTLQLAYVPRPRSLSLYAVRVGSPPVTTADLEPYLPTAGQYVGISGLHRDPWQLETVEGRLVWVRPEDDATALGTMIYTWASGEYLFLMIGVDDTLNRAMFAALPGEAAPTPSPRPSRSPRPTASPSATAKESAAPS